MAQKTVLITGCSKGGIGDALAKEFYLQGLRVFATARNLTKIQHLKEMGLTVLPLDVTDEASIKQAVESVKAETGGTLDILVNNSGGGYSMPLLDSDISVARKMFDLNVFALISVTQAFAPFLIASKGTIVNIGSVAGVAPLPWQGYYNGSKAAVNLLTDQLRLELSPWGVKAILVVTGGVITNFFTNSEGVQLPESSPYSPAKDILQPIMEGELAKNGGMDVDDYAEAVVANALKSNPKKHHWVGGSAFLLWFVSTFGWSTIWDTLFHRGMNFPIITTKIRAAEKAK